MFVFILLIPSDSCRDLNRSCQITPKDLGEAPVPLENEIIGASPAFTLYSVKGPGFIRPCFMYFGNKLTFGTSEYGVKLPVGTYNVYVQYLSYRAIDGDVINDQLIQTTYTGFNSDIVVQGFLAQKTATFVGNKAITEYETVKLEANNNTLRLESAIRGFTQQTLEVDRIEILFEKVL